MSMYLCMDEEMFLFVICICMMVRNKYQCDLCGYCVGSTFIIYRISLFLLFPNAFLSLQKLSATSILQQHIAKIERELMFRWFTEYELSYEGVSFDCSWKMNKIFKLPILL